MTRILVFGLLCSVSLLFAQSEEQISQLQAQVNAQKSGQSRFLMRGYAHSGLEATEERSSFVGGSFNPIFLWQQSDRLLFEAELELELEEGQTHLTLEYANMSYFLNDWATLRLGKFLMPFGIFAERIHPRWINRLPSNPLGFGHESVGPTSGLGAEIRGGAQFGASKINYAVYATNGPVLNSGEELPSEAGMLQFNNFEDNNKNKALGGRFGWLPFSNSMLEVGVSGQYARVGDAESEYQDIAARLFALDLSFVRSITPLKGVLDVKAQWNRADVDDADYPVSPVLEETYFFQNTSDAYFAQVTYRPAYVEQKLLKNLEFAGRYSSVTLPEQSLWGTEETQWTVGLNYWIDWRSVIKVAYQKTSGGHAEEGDEHGAEDGSDALLMHWSFGF